MEKVTGHTNLFRRGAVYYFRRRVPDNIEKTLGKTEVKFSLKTKDYQEALKRIRIESAKVESQFEEHRQELKRLSSPPLEDLSSEQLKNIHDVYYQYILEEDDETRLEGFYRGEMTENPVPSFEEYKEDIDTYEQATRGDYAEGVSNEFYLGEAMEVLSWSEVSLNVIEGSLAHKKVARKIQEAAIRAYESIQSRNKGVLVDTPDRPQKPLSESLSASNAPLLSEVTVRWDREKSRTSWVEKTREVNLIWAKRFIEVCGDKPIDMYQKSDAVTFKEVLLSLPPNWTHKYKGKTIVEAVRFAQENGVEPMNLKTAQKNLNFVGGLWKWIMDHYDLERNPFENVRISFKRNPQDERDSFAIEDLKKIFSSPVYTGCESYMRPLKSGTYCLKDTYRYWLPLIALYTVARSNEILQLTVDDIGEASGVFYFDFNKKNYKRSKTQASRRVLPVHQELIEKGFMELVRKRRAEGVSGRLFPEVKMGSDGLYSSSYGRHFSELLRHVGVKTDKKSFHSFRHTFEDACREAGVPKEIMDALQGHSSQDMSGRYGSGYSLHKLNEWLQKVNYGYM